MPARASNLAERLLVYLIADFSTRPEAAVIRATSEGLRAGVTAVQYRDKSEASPARRRARARRVLDLAAEHGALYIVNDDVDLAVDLGAAGVHLGPFDEDPAEARRRSGGALVIGGSAGTAERGRTLEEAGVDYLGVGAIFEARPTKRDASAPRGVEALRRMKEAVSVPIVAIGGIGPENAAEAFAAGADGVAVVRSVLDASDPALVVRSLLRAARSGRAVPASRLR